MQVFERVPELRAFLSPLRAGRVVFVPTMGFLHEGHLALMRRARDHGATVVSSIFVNPAQFGPNEDLSRYPRDLEGDLRKCKDSAVDAVFLPSVEVMYPAGHHTTISVGELSVPLCGRSRPTHFAGVCTVVAKLFNIVGCDVAIFGEKDFQQLAVIRQMVKDLDYPLEVVGHPIVREPDGLAMSSRNVNLTPRQRAASTSLSRGLAAAREAFERGEREPRLLEFIVRHVVSSQPEGEVDYIELRDATDLSALDGPVSRSAVLAVAVRFGGTRLIDNTVLVGPLSRSRA